MEKIVICIIASEAAAEGEGTHLQWGGSEFGGKGFYESGVKLLKSKYINTILILRLLGV